MDGKKSENLRELAQSIADGHDVDFAGLAGEGKLSKEELQSLRMMQAMRRISAGAGAAVEATHAAGAPLETGLHVMEEIGRGSHGKVFRALDRALDREVALKVLNESHFRDAPSRERFIREARLLAALDHENIVRIYSIDEPDGQLQIELEYVGGKTLQRIVKEDGPMTPGEAARVGIAICRALEEIHAAGLVHGDVKPSNVMRTPNDRIVLLDFGIARTYSAEDETAIAPFVAGTPVVMPPEQFVGKKVGPQADIFAVGAVLYWLVSGRFPFEGKTPDEIRERLEVDRATPLTQAGVGVSPAFAAVVERAIERDKGDRFASATEFIRALQPLLPESIEATKRQKAIRAFGGLALLVIAALTWRIVTAPEPLAIRADLFVERAQGRVELGEGGVIQLGDQLQLDVNAGEDLHVYVFNEDFAGESFQLFPIEGGDLENPLRAKATHVLPGTFEGDVLRWEISSAGGSELIAVVAGAGPVPEAEVLCARLPDAFVADDHRGMGVATTSPANRLDVAGAPRFSSLGDFVREMERQAERDGKVVVKTFRLRHADVSEQRP